MYSYEWIYYYIIKEHVICIRSVFYAIALYHHLSGPTMCKLLYNLIWVLFNSKLCIL